MNAVVRTLGLALLLSACGAQTSVDGSEEGGGNAGGGDPGGVFASCSDGVEAGQACQLEGQQCTHCCDDWICDWYDEASGTSGCQGNAETTTFTCVDGQFQAPPPGPPRCHQHIDASTCSSDPSCHWLVPGCSAPLSFYEGCFPQADCAVDGCDEASICRVVTLACADGSCDCVETETNVCLY